MKLRPILLAVAAGFLGFVAPTPNRVGSNPGFHVIATAEAIVSGFAPGRLADTVIVG